MVFSSGYRERVEDLDGNPTVLRPGMLFDVCVEPDRFERLREAPARAMMEGAPCPAGNLLLGAPDEVRHTQFSVPRNAEDVVLWIEAREGGEREVHENLGARYHFPIQGALKPISVEHPEWLGKACDQAVEVPRNPAPSLVREGFELASIPKELLERLAQVKEEAQRSGLRELTGNEESLMGAEQLSETARATLIDYLRWARLQGKKRMPGENADPVRLTLRVGAGSRTDVEEAANHPDGTSFYANLVTALHGPGTIWLNGEFTHQVQPGEALLFTTRAREEATGTRATWHRSPGSDSGADRVFMSVRYARPRA